MSSAESKDMTGCTPAPSATALEETEPTQVGTPSHPPTARHDQDEFGWLLEQADLLRHLLKVVVQSEMMTRSWALTIVVQQQEAQFLIEDEPGMRQYLPGLYAEAYPAARRRVSIETGVGIDRFPKDNPWTLDEALAFMPPALPPRNRKVTRKG